MRGKTALLGAVLGLLMVSGAKADLFDLKGNPDVGASVFGTYDDTTKHLVLTGQTQNIDGNDLDAFGNYSLDVNLATATGSISVDGDAGLGFEQFFLSSTVKAVLYSDMVTPANSTQVAIEFSNNTGNIATGQDFITIISFGGATSSWSHILDNTPVTGGAGAAADTAPLASVPLPSSAASGLGLIGLIGGATVVRRRKMRMA